MFFGDDEIDGEDEGPKVWKVVQPTKFAKELCKTVAEEGGFSYKDMKRYISVSQVKQYLMEYAHEIDEKGRPTIAEDAVDNVCEAIHHHLVGFDLTVAAGSGMLECYWDNEANTMMFMAPPKPEVEEPPQSFFDELKRIEEKLEELDNEEGEDE